MGIKRLPTIEEAVEAGVLSRDVVREAREAHPPAAGSCPTESMKVGPHHVGEGAVKPTSAASSDVGSPMHVDAGAELREGGGADLAAGACRSLQVEGGWSQQQQQQQQRELEAARVCIATLREQLRKKELELEQLQQRLEEQHQLQQLHEQQQQQQQ
jgi:hypothetical protein